MENSENMTTLSQVMERLKERGVHREFRMNENCEMKFENSDTNYKPSDLAIIKTYRFEGDSNPDDNAVLYLVKDTAGNMGMIIDSYGADSNYPGEEFDKFLRDIPVEESEDYSY
jgi:3-phosphoglycerate kinase